MRKKDRYIYGTALIGGIGFSLYDALEQYIETQERNLPFWGNYDGSQTFQAFLKGTLCGGVAGLAFYEIHKWYEKDLPFCPDNHLHQILTNSSIDADPLFIAKGKQIIDKLKGFIITEYGEVLIDKPKQFGSTKQKIAIGGSSDFDLLVPFSKNVGTLDVIYEDLFYSLENEFSEDCFELRRQRHSIGLCLNDSEHSIHFDIVPARERNNYYQTGDLTIQRRAEGFFETPTHIKTNLWKKSNHVVNRPEVRRIVKLLKIYKLDNQLILNSTAITTLVKESHDKNLGYVNSSIFNNLMLSMTYIADEILSRQFVKDIANSNINLIDNLTSFERLKISNLLKSDLEKIQNNPSYLKEIFEL